MKVTLQSDFPITGDACKAATGKTFIEWHAAMAAQGIAGRRDTIQWLYNEMGRGSFIWWATTVWVEYESVNGIVKKDGLAEGYTICVTKTIAASIDEIYSAWTQAGELPWLGSKGAQEGADYTDDGGNQGKWLRLRPGKDLRLSWKTAGVDTPTTVDIVITDPGKGKSLLTLTHSRIQTRDEADGMRNAWTAAFELLKKQLEA